MYNETRKYKKSKKDEGRKTGIYLFNMDPPFSSWPSNNPFIQRYKIIRRPL